MRCSLKRRRRPEKRLAMSGEVGGRGDATRIQTSINTLDKWVSLDQISKSSWSWKPCGYHYWITRSNSGNNERRKRRSRGKEARAVGQRKAQKLALLLQWLLLHLPQRNPRYRPLPRLHQHSCHPETQTLVAQEPAQDIARRLPCPGFPFRLGAITRLVDGLPRLWECLELPCGAQSVRPVRLPHHHQKRGAAAASICRRAPHQPRQPPLPF